MDQDEFGILSPNDIEMFPSELPPVEINYSKPNVNLKFDILNIFLKYFTSIITSANILSDPRSDVIMNQYLKVIKLCNQFYGKSIPALNQQITLSVKTLLEKVVKYEPKELSKHS